MSEAAEAAEVSVRCARKWVGRYRAEGEFGLLDRSSAPRSIPHRTSEQRVQAIAALRRLRFTGPEIAECLGMALSTVSGILTRIGMGKLGRLGLEPAQRYERQRPGELIHIDVKKLGRIHGGAGQSRHRIERNRNPPRSRRRRRASAERSAGSTCTSRSTTAPAWPTPRSSPTRRPPPSVAFLKRAIAFYARHGITVEQLLTDNGSGLPLDDPRASPAARWASATYAPAPTDPRPTARPSASSAPCSAAGPTARSTATAPNAPQPLTAGSGTTTITANTQPSATSRPSLASTSDQPSRDLHLDGCWEIVPDSRRERDRRRKAEIERVEIPCMPREAGHHVNSDECAA